MREEDLVETKNLWIDSLLTVIQNGEQYESCPAALQSYSSTLLYVLSTLVRQRDCCLAVLTQLDAKMLTNSQHHKWLRFIIRGRSLIYSCCFHKSAISKNTAEKNKTARVLNPAASTTCAWTGLDCAITSFKTTGCVHEAMCAVKVLYWLYWYAQQCSRIFILFSAAQDISPTVNLFKLMHTGDALVGNCGDVRVMGCASSTDIGLKRKS